MNKRPMTSSHKMSHDLNFHFTKKNRSLKLSNLVTLFSYLYFQKLAWRHLLQNCQQKSIFFIIRIMENKMSGSLNEKPDDLTPKTHRKQSAAEELTDCKKSCNDTENAASLNRVIHLKIPHIGERIFESFDTPE